MSDVYQYLMGELTEYESVSEMGIDFDLIDNVIHIDGKPCSEETCEDMIADLINPVSEFKWDKIQEEMIKADIEEIDGNNGEYQKIVWLGRINPSGKIYTFWTSNQTPLDVLVDEVYQDKLEKHVESLGYYLDWYDGDCRIACSVDKPESED